MSAKCDECCFSFVFRHTVGETGLCRQPMRRNNVTWSSDHVIPTGIGRIGTGLFVSFVLILIDGNFVYLKRVVCQPEKQLAKWGDQRREFFLNFRRLWSRKKWFLKSKRVLDIWQELIFDLKNSKFKFNSPCNKFQLKRLLVIFFALFCKYIQLS